MLLADKIRVLEEESTRLERVARLTEQLLGELMKSTPPPAELEKTRGLLRSAQALLKQGKPETAEPLAAQAEDTLAALRQWLAVGDLGVSPFFLRTHLEKNPPPPELQSALIRYFLTKKPHAENDRDKLDYLLTAWFSAGTRAEVESRLAQPKALDTALQELLQGVEPVELAPATEIMMHELESVIARIQDFTDFDQLVGARMVERVRALKTNLGESFYHPRVLSAVIRFNASFRLHFEQLLHEQLGQARAEARRHLEAAWALVQAIEAAYEARALPTAKEREGGRTAEAAAGAALPRMGRPLVPPHERPPIDNLVRRGEQAQQETELRGLINRLARSIEKLPAHQAQAEKLTIALRHTQLEIARWEREAFLPAATGTAPQSAHLIQQSVGVRAWLEEELAQYEQARADRYQWKTHFDHLSYALVRAVELLEVIRELMEGAVSELETAWFQPLLHTALRLADTLNRVAPVFEERAAA